ncbi:PREDICTED: uncharacterized protein PB18E9.04c-like [Papilio polytes]|uniref:uncharacterized protein PB18E9.04c-like n=1 Tax=Papilio polytes TaxID=76194 RepID=UPI000675EC47|nr:PREDICTED: uncharacterized protein PB18E9.04c-like [Papilio polytes]
MTSHLDEVMYVNNPIEAGLPGHWVPLSVIKRVLEMRASAVNYRTTPRKVKLKHLTIPLSHFKTRKHKAKSKHNLITISQDTNSPNDSELTGKSTKIEPEILNNIETKTKGLEDTITERAITTNENIDPNALPSSLSSVTTDFNNRDTGSTTLRATTVPTTRPSTKGTIEVIEVTNQLDNLTTAAKTTCTSLVLSTTTSTPVPLKSSTNEVSSTLETSTANTTTTSEPITTTIPNIPDTTKSTTGTIATIKDTTKPTTGTTATIKDTTKLTIGTTATIKDTTKVTTGTTATVPDTSESVTSTTTIVTISESTTTTLIMTSTQSTVITTEDSSERSDTGNPFY